MTLIYSLILVIISGVIMYSIVSDLISGRIEEENRSFLLQIRDQIQNEYEKLNSISTLFSPYGNMGELLMEFYATENVGEKAVIMTDIKAGMGVMTYSNPDINLCTFFFNEAYMDFIGTTVVIREFDPDRLPLLYSEYKNLFHGPHDTVMKVDKTRVISVLSQVDIGSSRNTYAYVESDFAKIERQLLQRREEGFIYQIRDESGSTLYSTEEDPIESKDYITYSASGKRGWEIVCLADPAAVREIEIKLIIKNIVRYPLFLIPCLIFSLMLAKIIGKPLQGFMQGVIQMEKGDFETIIPLTGIREFDILIERIQKAKERILRLMGEVREKEQKRAFAEISRLRAQINPHFVLNTLNSIHWMAQEKGQNEIDDTVLSLTRILSYNLQKSRFVAPIADELSAAEEYLKLQSRKYRIRYEINCLLGEDGLQQEIPRFILQPLIENSILHGKSEEIFIRIRAEYVAEGILFTLTDGGGRIDWETLRPDKLGIGLSFVFTALETYYIREDLISFTDTGSGLEIKILLPHEGENRDD
ncbi:MAG: histidine kinase [Spirochaetales bacterium]|nr:histidine kinase [Spirochaetales bacterium]